ncbi:hypothetical protein OG413_41250 [Streptomyces sp. NBC_01433]|uniref:hypothetical protein n=1 Tax=Streptomyces sp. NBC_01433 TaxID=2903864 RepID=UPI00224DCFF7|nr:hypothetical protein [Streptomyces sp. NBC_01433]MCX4681631.1 hypothetical protein [Streptomyces sp. NBC_01433]
MSSLLESVRGLGRDVAMPEGLPARVAVVTATYRSWSNFTPETSVVAKFAVLRARLGPEGYQTEGFSIWDAEAEGRRALARRVTDADLVVGSDLLGSHFRAWDRVVDVEPIMGRTADIFLSLYELRGGGSAKGLGLSDLVGEALGHQRERSKEGSGLFPAQVLWDDATLTLTLWEMAVRLRTVSVSGRPVFIDDAALAELTGRKARFTARADWAEHAADLVLDLVERDSEFMLREGSTLARGALLSRAEYAIPARDVPVTNASARNPAMAWLLAEEDFVSAAQVLGPRGPGTQALDIAASWSAHRLLWANFGQSSMPGLAGLSLSAELGPVRFLVPHGQRSIKALALAGSSDGDLVLVPDSRALRRVLKSGADPAQAVQVLAEAGGLPIPLQASAAIAARDAIVRWDGEQVLDTEAWVAAQAAAE